MSNDSFSLSAGPDTDVWKKPPSSNVYNAPIHALPPKPLSDFKSAKVTFSADWSEQYDQAGLILTFDSISGTRERRWIKTGVEYYNSIPQLSTVSCERWADWSITPLSALEETKAVTVSIEKSYDVHGVGLWVYYVKQDGTKEALREICWVYGDDDHTGKDWNVTVGALVARPAKDATGELKVQFEDFDVQWSS
ncbi:Uncharacterized protein C8034_v006165 [Colletotrichum sidae]|uniref:Uncharacterized protein n=4 Tax=Colletotrichum orbiculare species complex TaxID=2707354 RepID=N4VNL6_COLOR|nr:Uncharacterized protein Cob_v006117 [Colletotrichum orbiculare MAFF 240422]TDZ39262.1 Uncharacterized protein C8035_v006274 [Colletotrichum spinosum]TDZ71998.1 Uncharacterized protein CTRI78_v001631 [Colletotrichum trifolii]TEA12380.1 Uncharacterized protein C8034_v006165 [Colletotrichum sidae]